MHYGVAVTLVAWMIVRGVSLMRIHELILALISSVIALYGSISIVNAQTAGVVFCLNTRNLQTSENFGGRKFCPHEKNKKLLFQASEKEKQ
ncbi:MAG TPA: hypothetical protein DF383_05540 [Deltaproteobacteria bacterium]|nr:hypothetical protein [Deltaproteobacteria bacterium]